MFIILYVGVYMNIKRILKMVGLFIVCLLAIPISTVLLIVILPILVIMIDKKLSQNNYSNYERRLK